jgi:pectate lyase
MKRILYRPYLIFFLLLFMMAPMIQAQDGLIIQEESPGVCTMDGTVDSAETAAGYTGKGYANIDNGIGVGMSWSFSVAEDGAYKLTWRYALGGTDTTSRDGRLLADNEFTGDTVRFPHTGSTNWNSYRSTDTLVVYFNSGTHKIQLSSVTVKGLPNIDYFHIVGSGLAPAPCVPSFTFHAVANDTSRGSVTFSPVKEFYDDGTEITVQAAAKPGCFFHSWSGEESDTLNPFLFKIRQNTFLTALFYPEGTAAVAGVYGYATVQHDNGTPYLLTGGSEGPTVDANTAEDLIRSLGDDNPYVVRLSGFIKGNSTVEIKIKSDKTFLGTNDTAHIEGMKIALEGARNVILRDITFSKVLGNDLIELNTGSKNIWIDHCEFYTDRDHDDNEDYYDGMLDIKNESSFITVSRCYFHDHNKGILISSGDDSFQDSVQRITFHHNYFYNCNSRLPSIRFGKAHIFNNYYEKCNTAVNTRMNACVKVEYNYFENVGTGIGMLYSPVPGSVDLGENIYVNTAYSDSPVCKLFVPYDYASIMDETEDLPDLIRNSIRRYAGSTGFTGTVYGDPFSLKSFPNPAREWLILSFDLKEGGAVDILIYNAEGEEVFRTVYDPCTPGNHEIRLDIPGLHPGLYICRLQSGEYMATEKVVVR